MSFHDLIIWNICFDCSWFCCKLRVGEKKYWYGNYARGLKVGVVFDRGETGVGKNNSFLTGENYPWSII